MRSRFEGELTLPSLNRFSNEVDVKVDQNLLTKHFTTKKNGIISKELF